MEEKGKPDHKMLFEVFFKSKIMGGSDHMFVLAKDKKEALKIGKTMIDHHKLTPDFLNDFGRYIVRKAE